MPPVGPLIVFLNQASIQQASGASLNWTAGSDAVAAAFEQSGDMTYLSTVSDIADLLDKGVRVSLYAGDADYICNWFGGEAVSLSIDHAQADNFRKAGYAPFMVDGKESGAVRQYGNFSFLRVYNSGHQVPFFQRKSANTNTTMEYVLIPILAAAALALYNRTLAKVDIATGEVALTSNYGTTGPAKSTHRED